MQRVFAQLSVAHDTLANDERRAQYVRTPAPAPPAPPSRAVSRCTSAARCIAVASGVVARPAGARGQRDVTPRPRADPFHGRSGGRGGARPPARAFRFAPGRGARARADARAGTPVSAFVPSGTPGKAFGTWGKGPPRPDFVGHAPAAVDPSCAAVDALRRRYEDSPRAHARGKHAQENVHAASRSGGRERRFRGGCPPLPRGDGALGRHRTPVRSLPRPRRRPKSRSHGAAIARAKESEQKQDYGDAGANWARAFEIVPAAETAHRASLCFRRAGVDSRRAAKYGEEAVKLDGHKATYRVNLALVYCDLGLALRAHGEIERAQALDPQNAQVKEALVRIKAMR